MLCDVAVSQAPIHVHRAQLARTPPPPANGKKRPIRKRMHAHIETFLAAFEFVRTVYDTHLDGIVCAPNLFH